MSQPVITTRAELRRALGLTSSGLVPTMGALHAGHLALIETSASENAATVVSIFVNPAQFEQLSDLDHYPRTLEQDIASAIKAGATLVFAPPANEIYPPGFDTWVEVGDLAQRWEGAARPGHFRGVATVVAILLSLVHPARAYFGEKDFQQLQIVRRLHADLALPGEIVACPTVRDGDGLALSSRNARLSPEQRISALAIPRALSLVEQAVAQGEREPAALLAIGRAALEESDLRVDYFAIVDERTLLPVDVVARGARLLIAVEAGGVRLIDNKAIGTPCTESAPAGAS